MADILVIIPTYNERENITALCRELLATSQEIEILVVDDNSPDDTAKVVADLAATNERVHLVVREGKGGRGGAVLAGMAWGLARPYRLFFEMDADFSHRPCEVPLFLEAIRRADVVVGSRYLPSSRIVNWPRLRRFFSGWANRYARFFLGIPITDYTNGYRCYRREAAAAINPDAINARGYIVLSEIAVQLHSKDFKFAEVPTVFVNRRRGESNLSRREITSAFWGVLSLWWRYRRPLSP